jgi:acetylornithine deacetylase/succinyl-diaminopimelate desuccinylase-like protein
MLYAHYDVQPAPLEQGWTSDPYGRAPGEAGSGGSIALLQTLQKAAPNAEFVLWGPEDLAGARIHASDESVDPSEIERMILAQAFLLQRLAGAGE